MRKAAVRTLSFVALTALAAALLVVNTAVVSEIGETLNIPPLVLALLLTTTGELVFLGLGVGVVRYFEDTIDFRLPEGNDFLLVTAALFVLIVISIGASLAASWFGVSSPADTVNSERLPRVTFLLLIPLSLTIVSFAEELFFRRVIQNYLSSAVPVWLAIAVASLLFGLAHLPTLNFQLSPRSAITIVQITLHGAVFGLLYWHTDNILVPTLAHGLFNTLANVSSFVGA